MKQGAKPSSPNVCPYCRATWATQPELVAHLTADGGCPLRFDPKPIPRPGRPRRS
jgi:hypothetical protein